MPIVEESTLVCINFPITGVWIFTACLIGRATYKTLFHKIWWILGVFDVDILGLSHVFSWNDGMSSVKLCFYQYNICTDTGYRLLVVVCCYQVRRGESQVGICRLTWPDPGHSSQATSPPIEIMSSFIQQTEFSSMISFQPINQLLIDSFVCLHWESRDNKTWACPCSALLGFDKLIC